MFGVGIVKGLAETARNFFGSFVYKERLVTVQFPEERLPVAEAARNFPFLIYDGVDPEQGLRCVRGAGLDEAQRMSVILLVSSYVRAQVALEAQLAAGTGATCQEAPPASRASITRRASEPTCGSCRSTRSRRPLT